jgi:hypothetical protein
VTVLVPPHPPKACHRDYTPLTNSGAARWGRGGRTLPFSAALNIDNSTQSFPHNEKGPQTNLSQRRMAPRNLATSLRAAVCLLGKSAEPNFQGVLYTLNPPDHGGGSSTEIQQNHPTV